MDSYVLSFKEIEKTDLMIVGGKGLNLGQLFKIKGLNVPEGFCITIKAFNNTLDNNQEFKKLLDKLSKININEKDEIKIISKNIRESIEKVEIPKGIEEEIVRYISILGEEHAYAVRSSATAEDLPLASFAGQQDTYLNITGTDSILHHIKKCWASLFTERAVTYRIQNSFEHEKVYLSVVVQRMIFPLAAGIMFTADPITFNRKVLSIDASFGLGEALVSGLVNSDIYKVREGNIIDKKISTKKLAIHPLKEGGTIEKEINLSEQNKQTLTDNQILHLETLGRKIELYFGCPQDIEWCLYKDQFYIVQSRPITTLFPIPENDGQNRVYTSMGHLQMMTDDIKPLGMSFCKLLSFWFGPNLTEAGGRLYIDGTYDLASPVGRKILLASTGNADVLMKNAILNLMKRKDFVKNLPHGKGSINAGTGAFGWIIQAIKIYRKNDRFIINHIIKNNEELIQEMEQRITKLSKNEVFEFILQDTKDLKSVLIGPEYMSLMALGSFVSSWVNKKMEKWVNIKNAVDTLTKSVPNNITSEMGMDLLDVSDTVRVYPEVIEYFSHTNDDTFFEDLEKLEGGYEVSKALLDYLKKYGVRCPGEIDITRPRWSEKPTGLIPMILSNIRNSKPYSRTVKFEEGRLEAIKKEEEILKHLEKVPGSKGKIKKTKKMISVLRNVMGFREYPKYSFIKRFQIYKNALLREADALVQSGIIFEREDIYFLTFEELREVVNSNKLNYEIIRKRKTDYEVYKKLTPPRVMTSEGEVISGIYNTGKNLKNALIGVPVSSGIIEGRAKVVLKLEDAYIEEGDILVTKFTDPSWTPLFVAVKGLVTEVGGLMTHGAVITREYGLPGVVGVENATKLIKNGQMIRVNGTEGYIELL